MAAFYSSYNEEMLDEFVSVIRKNGGLTRSLSENIDVLTGRKTNVSEHKSYCESHGLVPVVAGRFQTMHVDEEMPIRDFVTNNGIKFKEGKGFYELTKSETVGSYKEIILQDKETGEMFSGDQVRDILKLVPQSDRSDKDGVKEKLKPSATHEYKVFVQSTSYNRKLMANTTFLYEMDDID
jgi:hypothetical protein